MVLTFRKFLRYFYTLFGLILLAGCNFTLAADITPPPGYKPATQQSVEPSVTTSSMFPLLAPDPSKGSAIYQEKCAPCHGSAGLGDGQQGLQLPNPVSAIGSAQLARKSSPAEWYRIVTEGNLDRFMPPFESLSDRQRWDVIAYVWSLSTSADIVTQGKELFISECARCHGMNGKGDGPDGGGGILDFRNQEGMAGKSDEELFLAISNGISPGMPAFAEKLSENERWAISSYIRSLSFSKGEELVNVPISETPEASNDEVQSIDRSELPAPEELKQKGTGVISGKVVNGTTGALPTGLEVQLHGFDHTSIVVSGTVVIDKEGVYLFDGIDMPEGRIFLTSVEFEDVTYASEAVAIEGGRTELDLPIQVYEPTTDASVLKIDRLHLFFEPINEQYIRVVELFIISNPSGKTLISSAANQPVLNYQIPAEATNLEIQDGAIGQRYISTKDGFGDTLPIRPGFGAYQLLFSYELPIQDSFEFIKPITLPVNAIVLLVPIDGISIKSDAIQDGGVREVQGTAYRIYNGVGITPGKNLSMTISRSSSFRSIMGKSNLFVGLSVLGVVLVASGLWLFRKMKLTSGFQEAEVQGSSAEKSEETRETLMDAILALDDLYQEGRLPEEAYIKRRNELKDRLKQIVDHSD